MTILALRKAGLEGEDVVGAFRILLIFSLGYAAFQAPRQNDEERSHRGESAFRSLPREEYQEVRSLAEPLARAPDDETFRAGIDWLLDGIERASGSARRERDE